MNAAVARSTDSRSPTSHSRAIALGERARASASSPVREAMPTVAPRAASASRRARRTPGDPPVMKARVEASIRIARTLPARRRGYDQRMAHEATVAEEEYLQVI